jgi:hypothetical protein
MAEFRQVHCKTWRDDWFSELDTDSKLLWLYLITNQATSVSGIYLLPRKFIAFETGLSIKRINEIMLQFKHDKKIDFDDSVIWICKMREYQAGNSPKVATRIALDFDSVPACRVKGIYAQKYHIDTVSIPFPESESDTDTDTDTDTIASDDAPKPEKQNPRNEAIAQLESSFSKLSGLPLPKRDTDKDRKAGAASWWIPLGDIWILCGKDADKASSLIEKSYRKLIGDSMTVASPKSLIKTATALFAQNGHKPAIDPEREAALARSFR